MKILALDPAEHTGYAHSDGHMGVWLLSDHCSPHPGARLERLRERLYEAYREWGFVRLAFEDASFGSPNHNVKAMHNELRGVIKLVAAERTSCSSSQPRSRSSPLATAARRNGR